MRKMFGMIVYGLLLCGTAQAHDELAETMNAVLPAITYIQVENYTAAELFSPTTHELTLANIPNRPIVGTGFVIDGNNIVTNYHVIAFAVQHNTDVFIKFKNSQQKYKAKILGYDKVADVALLEIEGDHPSVMISECSDVQMGDPIFSISHFYGIGWSGTQGTISSNDRQDTRYPYINNLQVQLLQGSGSSGGPVFNEAGEVIALNRSILSMFPRSLNNISRTSSMLSMVGYPIRGDTVFESVNSIREDIIVVYMDLGVSLIEFGEDSLFHLNYTASSDFYPYGTMVLSIDKPESSPFKESDIIISVEGETFTNPAKLLLWINEQNYKAGDTVNIQVYRDSEIINIAVELKLAGL